MSNPRLPAELLDHVVDFLYGSRNSLESCCLVSKSWIPRARKHLFADLVFTAKGLQRWKTTFPNPSTSPARYIKDLLITCPLEVVAADGKEGGWITAFTRVVRFELDAFEVDVDQPGSYLTPFHGFSPALKSLHLTFYSVPSPQVFDLICSFPLLDDLTVASYHGWIGRDETPDDQTTAIQSLTSPSFNGSLELDLWTGTDFMASGLLSLPGGLHFRRLHLELDKEIDASPITALVEGCRFTLGSLEVACNTNGASIYLIRVHTNDLSPLVDLPGPIDLSRATQLKDTVFSCNINPRWIADTLRTITDNHTSLRRASVVLPIGLCRSNLCCTNPADAIRTVGGTLHQEWLEIDRFLAHLLESQSIPLEVTYGTQPSTNGQTARSLIECLLPELTGRGLVGLTAGK